MKAHILLSVVVIAAALLAVTGCDNSTSPLSDPQKAKPDRRLAGVWRELDKKSGSMVYYHIGRAGGKLPDGVMRVIMVGPRNDGVLESPGEWLLFPTTLGGSGYVNLRLLEPRDLRLLEEEGWKPEAAASYIILKYRIDGEKLLLWNMDEAAKRRAIAAGKIKGIAEKKKKYLTRVAFTDTTENVARLVAGEGDALFSKEPVFHLERVK